MRVVPVAVIAVLACLGGAALAQAPGANSPTPPPETAPPPAAVPPPLSSDGLPPPQHSEAPPPPPPANARLGPPARFSFNPVAGGFLRLDAQTGQVAFCSARTAGWTCETAAEDRAALETEIGRLQDEAAGLKRQNAELQEPPPPRPPADLAPPAPPPDKRDDAAQLREDLERARAAFENAWRRLVDMLVNFQKDVMRKS
jgi:hypothetical protein